MPNAMNLCTSIESFVPVKRWNKEQGKNPLDFFPSVLLSQVCVFPFIFSRVFCSLKNEWDNNNGMRRHARQEVKKRWLLTTRQRNPGRETNRNSNWKDKQNNSLSSKNGNQEARESLFTISLLLLILQSFQEDPGQDNHPLEQPQESQEQECKERWRRGRKEGTCKTLFLYEIHVCFSDVIFMILRVRHFLSRQSFLPLKYILLFIVRYLLLNPIHESCTLPSLDVIWSSYPSRQ